MSASTRTLAALLLALLAAPAVAKDDYVYGPAPDWAEYTRLGEAAIRSVLPDPEGWAIEWPNGYVQASWIHKGRTYGYVTCGIARAVKPVAGGFLSHPFAVVIDRGAVKQVDWQPKPENGLVNLICRSAAAQGRLPPASMMPDAAVASTHPAGVAAVVPATITSLGISVRPMPEGAYLTSVTSGSPAAAAGLTPGMVITKANNIPLFGMGEAMGKLLAADTSTLSIETATGAHFQIKRTRK